MSDPKGEPDDRLADLRDLRDLADFEDGDTDGGHSADPEAITSPEGLMDASKTQTMTVDQWWAKAKVLASETTLAQDDLARAVAHAVTHVEDPCAVCTVLIGAFRGLLPRLPFSPAAKRVVDGALGIAADELRRALARP